MALVLSGGGAKGAFEAGVIARLEQAGVVPRTLSGTSAGAINAAALAVGMPADELVELWSSMRSRDVYRFRRDLYRLVRPWHLFGHPDRLLGLGTWTASAHLLDSIGWSWIFDTSPLRKLLVRLLGGEELPIAPGRVLTVSVVEAASGRQLQFASELPPDRPHGAYVETAMTVDHVLASAAIPGLFRPQRIDGELYWDGGLVSNTPLQAALPFCPDRAFVVATGAIERQGVEPNSLEQVVSLMADHVMRFGIVSDLDHAETVNRLVRASPEATYHRDVELIPIVPEPRPTGLGRFLDFEPEIARDLIQAGRDAAERALRRLDAG